MRVPMIVGNWKMNTTVNEAIALVREMLPEIEPVQTVERVICPPFISLWAVKELLSGSTVELGAQNMYFEEKGAYTGEISPLMLAELCQYVIIGHSERRQYFGETGELINKKINSALKFNLKPILCIGEKLEENETGQTESVITEQLKSALDGIDDISRLTIAYEPIWAIGTGLAATGGQANNICGIIRRYIAQKSDQESAQNLRILYGGSVTTDNTAEFMQQPEIDGALVGGACLKSTHFVSIIKQTAEIRGG